MLPLTDQEIEKFKERTETIDKDDPKLPNLVNMLSTKLHFNFLNEKRETTIKEKRELFAHGLNFKHISIIPCFNKSFLIP